MFDLCTLTREVHDRGQFELSHRDVDEIDLFLLDLNSSMKRGAQKNICS